jgi:hypothetical protein
MRSNHWSTGKFADFVRGTPMLKCGTSEEWKAWTKQAKEKHPIRYWVAEELLDKFQDIVMYPIDKLYEIKYWFLNYFISKTHALTSDLKRGSWYELDERILHCLFTELVNFVEKEKSWANVVFDPPKRKKCDCSMCLLENEKSND